MELKNQKTTYEVVNSNANLTLIGNVVTSNKVVDSLNATVTYRQDESKRIVLSYQINSAGEVIRSAVGNKEIEAAATELFNTTLQLIETEIQK